MHWHHSRFRELRTAVLSALCFCVCQAIIFSCLSCDSQSTRCCAQVTDQQLAATKTISTFLTGFSIPFKVDENDESLVEVQLFLSKDKGKNWGLYDKQATDEREFAFKSDGDGEYWFALRTLDRNRRLLPESRMVGPELRVIVDTKKPKLDFVAESDAAGRVVCRWRVADSNIDPRSVKIFYKDAASSSDTDWLPVDAQLNKTVAAGIYTDQIAWWPKTPARNLKVRFQIADTAGNEVATERSLLVEYVAQIHRSQSTAYPATNRNSNGSANRQVANHGSHAKASPSGMVCKDGQCTIAEPGPPQPAPRKSLFQQVSSGLRRSQQIGSPAEYIQPPTPSASVSNSLPQAPTPQAPVAQAPVAQVAQNVHHNNLRSNSQVITWESKRKRWTNKSNTVEASTTARNQFRRNDIEPAAPLAQRSSVPAKMASHQLRNQGEAANAGSSAKQINGQSFVKTEGDMVISQSTAIGRGRKWKASSERPAALGQQQAMRWKSGTEQQLAAAGTEQVEKQAIPTRSASFPSETKINTPITPAGGAEVQSVPVGQSVPPQQIGPTTQLPTPQPEQHSMPVYNPNRNLQRQPAADSNENRLRQQEQTSQPPVQYVSSGLPSGVAEQIVNSHRFRLNYGIQSIDPSGVARVVLWMTRDGGASWASHATDNDNQSPFPVEVSQEGSYGFKVVVHSRDGLAGKAPSSGEAPDVMVHVDATKPRIQITSAPYGRGAKVGHLMINWVAFDHRLVSHPIRLAYSTTLAGPWTTIKKGLENTGSYAWKVPTHIPRQIYLRAEARDAAGNATAHELETLVDLSGLTPRGRVLGIESAR